MCATLATYTASGGAHGVSTSDGGNGPSTAAGDHRRYGRKRPPMVRFRCLRLFRQHDLGAVLSNKRSALLDVADIRGVWRRLRHAPDRLDLVWHLRRPFRP